MKNIITYLFVITILISCSPQQKKQEAYEPTWESLQKHQTPEWFKDAKFGIYFHWGVYSYMGQGEWYSHHIYEDKSEG